MNSGLWLECHGPACISAETVVTSGCEMGEEIVHVQAMCLHGQLKGNDIPWILPL